MFRVAARLGRFRPADSLDPGRRSQMEFKLATADLGDGIFSVSVAGEVDLATAPELKDALGEVVQAVRPASSSTSRTRRSSTRRRWAC